MDIDDILADIDRDSIPQETQDLQALTRAWVAERVAPEVLPYPTDLLDRVQARIRKQIERVEEETGTMDPKANFRLIVIQTELERFKFLVRSFLRARLAKIDAHQIHYIQASESPEQPNLSPSERQYLTAHHALLSRHYQGSFLSQFPAPLQRLDDTAGGISMVDRPDADKAVFIRVLRDVGVVAVDGTDSDMDLKRGDVWVVRWSAVKQRWENGDVELI